jgi:hypothetical protein
MIHHFQESSKGVYSLLTSRTEEERIFNKSIGITRRFIRLVDVYFVLLYDKTTIFHPI